MDLNNNAITSSLTEIPSFFSIHNMFGTYLYSSLDSEELFGYKPNELIGKDAYDFFYADDINSIKESHYQVIEKNSPIFQITYRLKHKNGSLVWVRTISHARHESRDSEECIYCFTSKISANNENA